jgi:hypothetical protein
MDARTAREVLCSSVDVDMTTVAIVLMTTMPRSTTGRVNPRWPPSLAPAFFLEDCIMCCSSPFERFKACSIPATLYTRP